MGFRTNISLLIFVIYSVTSALCCSHEPCSEVGVKTQTDQQHQTQSQEGHKSQWSHQIQPEDKSQWSHQIQPEDGPTPVSTTSTTTSTIRPIKSVVELVHGGPETVAQSIEPKELHANNGNTRGDERFKRHVHLDLGGYGYGHSAPLFGFQDYHYDHGYGHYDHYDLDHHHHSHHHGHHH